MTGRQALELLAKLPAEVLDLDFCVTIRTNAREGEFILAQSLSVADVFYQNTDGDPTYWAEKPGETFVLLVAG